MLISFLLELETLMLSCITVACQISPARPLERQERERHACRDLTDRKQQFRSGVGHELGAILLSVYGLPKGQKYMFNNDVDENRTQKRR